MTPRQRMGPRQGCIAMALLGALATPTAAAAQPQPVKVVLVGAADDPTVVRVRHELGLLGFRVDVLANGASAEPAALARSHGANAVAVFESWPPEVVIWVQAAPGNEPAEPSTIRVTDSLGPDAQPDLLALRAVESLRGSLLPLPPLPREPSPPPGSKATPTADTPSGATAAGEPDAARGPSGASAQRGRDQAGRGAVAAPKARPAAIALSPTVTLSPGGIPAMFQLRLGGSYRIVGPLGLQAHALVPTAPATIGEPEGEVGVRLLGFGAGLSLDVLAPPADWTLAASVGMGAAGLLYDAQPAGFEGSSGSSWASNPYLGLNGSYRLIEMLALRADGQAGLLLPTSVVRVAQREVASFGLPVLAFSLGVELRP